MENTNAICVLPFLQFMVTMAGHAPLCCHTWSTGMHQDTVHDKSIEQLFHSDYRRKVRTQMSNGEWPVECARCRYDESLGLLSQRLNFNRTYQSEYEQILSNPITFHPTIRILDIRISNICNFACRMCSSHSSSRWYTDEQSINPSMPSQDKIIGIHELKPFWQELETDVLENLKEVYFAGGEPLIIDRHYGILENLITLKKSDIRLSYNTNFSILKYKEWDIVELWKSFPNLSIGVSIDGAGAQGEYIRHGSDWDLLVSNLERINAELPRAQMGVHLCVSIFNVLDFREHFNAIAALNLIGPERISPTCLNHPAYLSIQVLHPGLKRMVEERLREMIRTDAIVTPRLKTTIEGLIQFMYRDNLYPQLGNEFKRITGLVDKARNQDYLSLFPGLEMM